MRRSRKIAKHVKNGTAIDALIFSRLDSLVRFALSVTADHLDDRCTPRTSNRVAHGSESTPPVLHVQLPTSRRDATHPVVQHLHRSSARVTASRRNNGTITSRLFHCQYLPRMMSEKCHFVDRRASSSLKGAPHATGSARRHACDEVGHNLSSADAVDSPSFCCSCCCCCCC